MLKHTLGLAALLATLSPLALTSAARAQDPIGNSLPDAPSSAPSPHDDTAYGANARAQAEDANDQFTLGKLSDADKEKATQQYNAAIRAYKSGKLDDAVKNLQEVLKIAPKDLQAQKVLAYAYLRQNKPADALPLLEAGVKETPKDTQTRDNLGRAYLAMSRPADAATQFKAVLAMAPKDDTATKGLAMTQAKAPVKSNIQAVAKEDPKPKKSDLETAGDYKKKADQLLKDNKFDDAMAAYTKAADLDSKNADLRLFIGEQYMKAGQPDKGIPAVTQALALNTKHAYEAHTMLGEMYAPNDPAKAITEFKAAAAANSKDPAAWYNLGALEQQAGDNAGARIAYKKALALHPSDPMLADHAQKNLDSLPK